MGELKHTGQIGQAGQIELDLIDKKILSALNQDVRATYSQIAKKVRSSKEVVNYRIKRLEKEGIIKEYVTITGFGYWPSKVLVSFSKITPVKEKEIIGLLLKNHNVNWLTSCSGDWDLVFTIMAKDPRHLDSVIRSVMIDLKEHVQDYKISTSVGSLTFGHNYLLGSIKEPEVKKRSYSGVEFDEKDKKIVKILLNDARARLLDISTKTGIPIDTVNYRMNKMEKNGIIKRYRMILDSSKLGYNRNEIFLRCVNLSDNVVEKFRHFSKIHSNVEYFSKCVGSWDVELTVHFKTNKELRDFIFELKKDFGDNIQKFELVNLFETYNFTYLPEELR